MCEAMNITLKSSPTSNRYLIRSFISQCISKFVDELLKNDDINVLDIGCGIKPYEIFFKKVGDGIIIYIGIERNRNTAADIIAVGELSHLDPITSKLFYALKY